MRILDACDKSINRTIRVLIGSMQQTIFSRIRASSRALLAGIVILMVPGALQGCGDRPRITYNLAVENRTQEELANVRVSIDHTTSGAKFGFLVSSGQKTFGLFNTPLREGYLLRYENENAADEWSSWLPFTTDDLPDSWDGEIRLLIDEDMVQLQVEPQGGAKRIVAQGAIATGNPWAGENSGSQ